MRKTWVKRENIYYKPFYKQKSKMLLLGVFLLGIVFIIYQAFSINQLHSASTPWSLEDTMKGLRKKHLEVIKSLGRKQNDDYDEGGGGGEGVAALEIKPPDDFRIVLIAGFVCSIMIRINQTSTASFAVWTVAKRCYLSVSMMTFAIVYQMEVTSPAQTLVKMEDFIANTKKDTSRGAA